MYYWNWNTHPQTPCPVIPILHRPSPQLSKFFMVEIQVSAIFLFIHLLKPYILHNLVISAISSAWSFNQIMKCCFSSGLGTAHPWRVVSGVPWAPGEWQSWGVCPSCPPPQPHPCWGGRMCHKADSSCTGTLQPTLSEPGWYHCGSVVCLWDRSTCKRLAVVGV